MKNVMTGAYVKGEELIDFNFITDLSIADKQKFVNLVVSLVVNDETKKYNSIIKDLVFDFYIIDFLSDIDTTGLKESIFFIKDVEQFLDETNIVDIIKANMKVGLLEELNKAIDLNIQYITGIHPNPLNEALASLVNTLEKKVKEVDLDSAMKMAQKFAGMVGELTPESVVNAYIDSDMHKKNLEEIAEAKAETNLAKDKLIDATVEE